MKTLVRYRHNRLDVVTSLTSAIEFIHREYEHDVLAVKKFISLKEMMQALEELGFVSKKSREGSTLVRRYERRQAERKKYEQYLRFMKQFKVVGFAVMKSGRVVNIDGKPVVSTAKGPLLQRIEQARILRKFGTTDEFARNGYSLSGLYIEPIYDKIDRLKN